MYGPIPAIGQPRAMVWLFFRRVPYVPRANDRIHAHRASRGGDAGWDTCIGDTYRLGADKRWDRCGVTLRGKPGVIDHVLRHGAVSV